MDNKGLPVLSYSIFKSAAPVASAFNGATFQKPHESASRPGVSANRAMQEANAKLPSIQEALKDIGQKLGVEAKPEMLAGGRSGLAGKIVGAAALATAAAISPVAAVGIAGVEAARFIGNTISGAMQPEEKSSFVDYAKTTKYGRASVSENRYAEQELANYKSATGEVYVNGFAQQPGQPAAQPGRRSIMPDERPTMRDADKLQQQFTTLLGQHEDQMAQGVHAKEFSFRNNIAMEQGPPPPTRMAGPMAAAPGFS